jgi:mRNA interferase MazF
LPTSDSYQAGDVVVVPFPHSDRQAEKRRPVLVVSNHALAAQGFIWVVMITSAVQAPHDGDEVIADLAGAGLTVACRVRPSKIACIEPSRILRRVGRLEAAALARVGATIRGWLGCKIPQLSPCLILSLSKDDPAPSGACFDKLNMRARLMSLLSIPHGPRDDPWLARVKRFVRIAVLPSMLR